MVDNLIISFLRSNWKILHLAKFFTQPAVVMVVTNMRCDDDDDLSGGGDEADCVDARSSSWYQGSRSVTFDDYDVYHVRLCPVSKKSQLL